MIFEFNRYSSLLLIFFVHGLVYAAILLRRSLRHDRPADGWLAFFLLLCIFYISPWMLGFAGWYEQSNTSQRNFLFYTPLQHTLLMGPVIYYYIRAVLYPARLFVKTDAVHFIPAVVYLLWCAVVFIADRLVLKKYYLMNGRSDPDFDSWYVAIGLLGLLVYGALSFLLYRRYRYQMEQEASFADAVAYRWIRRFLMAYLFYFLCHLVFKLTSVLGFDIDYTTDWWYYFLFGCIFYYVAIAGHAHSVQSSSTLRLQLTAQRLGAVPDNAAARVAHAAETENTIAAPAEPDLEAWKQKIYEAVVHQKLYTNPELTLPDVAAAVGTNTALASKIINAGFGQNFNDFVNSHRVAMVKKALQSGAAQTHTIMSLAYDAGFNSKPTFNRAFKKFTGKTPKDFVDNTAA